MRDRTKEHKATAIVLRRNDVFDADRSYLLFTREFGVIRARGRGVRKPGSKLGGHLLLYHVARLELIETGDWYLIGQAQLLAPQELGEASLRYLGFGSLLLEPLIRLLQEREVQWDLFDGLFYTLERLAYACQGDEPDWRIRLLVAEFLMKALVVLGYTPNLEDCVVTNERVTSDGVGWSSELGGVLSMEGMRTEGGRALRFQDIRSVVALRQMVLPEFVVERLQLPQEVGEEVVKVVLHYMQTIIGRPLSSAGV